MRGVSFDDIKDGTLWRMRDGSQRRVEMVFSDYAGCRTWVNWTRQDAKPGERKTGTCLIDRFQSQAAERIDRKKPKTRRAAPAPRL